MNNIRYYIFAIVLVIVQLLVGEYVNIWPMLYIAVYVAFLIVAPYNRNFYLNIFTAFFLGMLIDLIHGGVYGLNAAAATAVAFFRNPVMKIMLSKVSLEKITEIQEQAISSAKFIQLASVCYSIFFIIYMFLDGWGYYSFIYTLLRFAVNVIANSLIAFVVWKTLFNKILR